MNILEETKRILKMNPALQTIPVLKQIEIGLGPAADHLPDEFVAELARVLFENTNGDIRVDVIPRENVRTDKNGELFSFLRGTDILCHERNIMSYDDEDDFHKLVEDQTPCLFLVKQNPKNGKMVSRYCSVYNIPSSLGFKIASFIKDALLNYCDGWSDYEEGATVSDDMADNSPTKEVLTELVFGEGAWTKYYKFVYNKQIGIEEFKGFLAKQGLLFVPTNEETLEMNTPDGGTVWFYYAEKGEIPEDF